MRKNIGRTSTIPVTMEKLLSCIARENPLIRIVITVGPEIVLKRHWNTLRGRRISPESSGPGLEITVFERHHLMKIGFSFFNSFFGLLRQFG